jgi:superoxide reductase
MASQLEIYKCEVCGNIIEVLHAGGGIPACCDKTMKRFIENTVDAAKEKHVPVIEKVEGGFKVKVGAVAHPMEEKHYIEWIEVIDGARVYRQFLKPGSPAEAVFITKSASIVAREYCNLHGLWKGA